jgi:threonine aldolase
LGTAVKAIAARADSVMFCLSKGLCAPVGSLLAGKRDFVEAARMKRKIMGGGMRQAGILAAAGIIALQEMTSRLTEDHDRAKWLARGLAKLPGIVINPGEVDINMVYFSFPPARERETADRIVEQFANAGIRINAPGQGVFRFVTHYWIGDTEAERILQVSGEAFKV